MLRPLLVLARLMLPACGSLMYYRTNAGVPATALMESADGGVTWTRPALRDSPPSNIASYPFQPTTIDLKKVRSQLGRLRRGETYVEGEDLAHLDD